MTPKTQKTSLNLLNFKKQELKTRKKKQTEFYKQKKKNEC